MINVTVRLNDANGENIGTMGQQRHFGPDAVLTPIEVDGKTYVVVGGNEGPGKETLYVKPMGGQPEN